MSNRLALPVCLSVCLSVLFSVCFSPSLLALRAPRSVTSKRLSANGFGNGAERVPSEQQQFVAVSPLRHAPRRLTCNINKNSHACVADICTCSKCTSLQARRSCKSYEPACCCVRSENKCVWAYAVASQQLRPGRNRSIERWTLVCSGPLPSVSVTSTKCI